MNRSEFKEKRKVIEEGEKRKLSPGYTVDRDAKQAESDLIEEQTAEFIANKGKVEKVEFGTMKGDTKGVTTLRINHERKQGELK